MAGNSVRLVGVRLVGVDSDSSSAFKPFCFVTRNAESFESWWPVYRPSPDDHGVLIGWPLPQAKCARQQRLTLSFSRPVYSEYSV